MVIALFGLVEATLLSSQITVYAHSDLIAPLYQQNLQDLILPGTSVALTHNKRLTRRKFYYL